MPTLILVKHSLPEIVENVPAREWKLSAQGRLRCKQLAERLAKYQPTQIICSVEPKAKETAEFVAKELGLAACAVECLHEHERSKAGYLSKEKFEELVREFFARPDELVFGSETANEACQRFQSGVDWILKKFPNQTTVVVAHGTVISLYVSRFNEISALSIWNQLGLPSFVVLDVESKTMIAQENIE